MVKALPFTHQPDRVARKASDASAVDWRNPTHVKNILYFFTCVVSDLLRGNSVAGTFFFLDVLMEEDSAVCKYMNYTS